MRFKLIRDTSSAGDINAGNIREFENAIVADPDVHEVKWHPAWVRTVAGGRALWRKAGLPSGPEGAFELPAKDGPVCKFAVLLGPSFHRCAGFISGGRKAAYLFDATLPWIRPEGVVKFARQAGIQELFVDHPEFVEPIRSLEGAPNVRFVAAGVDPDVYRSSAEKDIEVLEFGRKMPGYHDTLVKGLAAAGVRHEHGFVDGREEFLNRLGRAKITISFPRSMTDGETAFPMLTMRYFQAMASRSLVVGSAPPLLKELFGYNPVIEADLGNPTGQILDILADFPSFAGLIEKNHRELVGAHTYRHRWLEIKALLAADR